jgi:hypothetical protein
LPADSTIRNRCSMVLPAKIELTARFADLVQFFNSMLQSKGQRRAHDVNTILPPLFVFSASAFVCILTIKSDYLSFVIRDTAKPNMSNSWFVRKQTTG